MAGVSSHGRLAKIMSRQKEGQGLAVIQSPGAPGLVEAFSSVPDPRGRRGRRRPLPAVLAFLRWAQFAADAISTPFFNGVAVMVRNWRSSCDWPRMGYQSVAINSLNPHNRLGLR